MRGRKPLTTEQKVLQGTDQPCRINKLEPKVKSPIFGSMEPPEYLSSEAKVHWNFIFRNEGGLWIKVPDRAMLEQYCEQWAELTRSRKDQRETREEIKKITEKVKDCIDACNFDLAKEYSDYLDSLNSKDRFISNLLVKSATAFKSVASELGLTPSSRSRVIGLGPELAVAKEDESDMLFSMDEIRSCMEAGLDYDDKDVN